MDLAIGAKSVYVMMEHLTKQGESKIVARCTYPVTGLALRQPHLHRPRGHRRDAAGLVVDRHRRRACRSTSCARLTGVPLTTGVAVEHAGDLTQEIASMPEAFICDADPHAVRPLRRRARRPCAPTTSARSRSQRSWSAIPASTGARSTTCLRLRQPGRRGQPQRRPHGAAARRAAAGGAGHDGQPPVRLEPRRHRASPRARSRAARRRS